jgi:NADPH:quinone reductase-like Zn-dependent oxidoreductase
MLTANPFLVRLRPGAMFKPTIQILGIDIAGVVEAVGSGVTLFKPGDEVFGDISQANGGGGFAEYVAVTEKALALKSPQMSFEEAAAMPMAAVTALQGLRDGGGLQPGHKVLINGSSGGVGTFAVQIAKALGAEVTAVCSTGKMEQARRLGADHVIDYTKENFTKNGQKYDIILAVNGYQPIIAYRDSLTPQGRYVMIGGSGSQLFQALLLGSWMSKEGGKKLGTFSWKADPQDLTLLKEMFEAGKVKPVMDKTYPLRELPEAMRYVGSGHATGKVVILPQA